MITFIGAAFIVIAAHSKASMNFLVFLSNFMNCEPIFSCVIGSY